MHLYGRFSYKILENKHLHTDSDLFQRFQGGSEAAFTAIYHRFYSRVYYFARRYVTDADAQDVAAEAFFKLWTNRRNLEGIQHLSSFLFVVTRNQCLTLITRQHIQQQRVEELKQLVATEQTDFSLEPVRIELVALLQAQIAKLPEKTRAVFLLSFREGLKPAQIAEQLGVSVKTVKNQKVTAIRLLREALARQPLELILLALLQLEIVANA